MADVQVQVRGQDAMNACLCFPNSMAASVSRIGGFVEVCKF